MKVKSLIDEIEPDGSRYRGERLGGRKHGFGRLFFPTGGRYEGAWENDLMHGFGIYIYLKRVVRDTIL